MNGTSPGELVLHSLLRQFSSVCQTKVERALADRGEKNLAKSMRIYEDSAYQQLLAALSTCAEYALPSLLQTLTGWYDFQHSTGSAFPGRQNAGKEAPSRIQPASTATPLKNHSDAKVPPRDQVIRSMQTDSALKASCPTLAFDQPDGADTVSAATAAAAASWLLMSSSEREALGERRDLSIDILYCQALTSVLKQLSFHPGHDEIINKILQQAFKHFEYKDNLQSSENKQNINLVADMYAEVVGELTQTRFALVRQHFTEKLARLRAKESSSFITHSIISLLMGMKFFRVKMHPIEEFVSYFEFLHELGQYFLEVKEKEIRHAMAGLFVEILLPVAAVARHEVNIPALKSFVDLLYSTTYELANKKKHVLALFPMVTCLLCISTKSFFLTYWPPFLSLCLSQLKSRDLGRVSLESLFRLLWVYVVRIKCEKHTDTQNKLQSIVNGLFPKGSKAVLPKNVASSVFVKLIQFIAQEKLDFAMTEIIFDLLGVNRLPKPVLMPERMNIGLCAFLLIAHCLQQRDGEPPMPQEQSGVTAAGSASVAPHHQTHNYHYYYSGQLQPHRMGYVRRSFHGTTLDDALCERLGIEPYLTPVRKAFEAILRLLDLHVCRNMMPPKQNVAVRDVEEPLSSDRKPKIDLLKTCINCIPRLLPYEMSRTELVELLARVSLNVDEEVRMMAQQAMVNLIIESPPYRQKTIQAFIQFIQKYVPDTSPHQLDCGLKTLYTLLVNWKIALQRDAAVTTSLSEKSALVEAEGFALVMLCQCRPLARRLAVHILRETRAVLRLINLTATANREAPTSAGASAVTAVASPELCCIDVLDSLAPVMLEQVLPLLPNSERHDLMNMQNIDFRSIAERSNPVWFSGPLNPALYNQRSVVNSQPPAGLGPFVASSRPVDLKSSGGFVPTTWSGASLQEQSRVLVSADKSGVTGSAVGRPAGTEPGVVGGRKVSTVRPAMPPLNSYCQLLQSPFPIQPQRERTQLTDVWGTVIAVALSVTSPLSCHPSMLHTWSIVFQRIHQLFPLIDPVTLATENRTSSILQRTSKKPTTERDQLLPLWHNYVVLACCIAPSSTGVCVLDRTQQGYADVLQVNPFSSPKPPRLRAVGSVESMPNPPNTAAGVFESNTVGPTTAAAVVGLQEEQRTPAAAAASLNSKLFLSAKENARDLVKLILPLLRCEQVELRESIICGLSRIQPAAFRDVLEDLHPILKDTTERKQENVRRRRRRDILRVCLIRLLAHMAKNAVFQHAESYITTNQGHLLPVLVNFIEWTRAYLESVSEPTSVVVTSVGAQQPSLLVRYASAPATASTAAAIAAAAAASSNSAVDGGGLGNIVAVGGANTTVAAAAAAAVAVGPGGSPGTAGGVAAATSVTPAGALAALPATSTPATLAPPSAVAGSASGAGAAVGPGPPAGAAPAPTAAVSSSSSSSSHAQALPDPALVAEARLFFCIFIRDLIRHLTREKRQKLLSASLRRGLFLLFTRWSGFYEHIHNGSDTKWSHNNASEAAFGKFGLSYKHTLGAATVSNATVGPPTTLVDHVSGDLVVAMASITSADPSSTDTADQYANTLSGVDSGLWLELIWYANQAMGAVVCCGPIFDPCALFLGPPALAATPAASLQPAVHVRSMSCSVTTSGEGGGTRATVGGGVATGADELALMAQSMSLTTVSTSSTGMASASAASTATTTAAAASSVDGQATAPLSVAGPSAAAASISIAASAPTSSSLPASARTSTTGAVNRPSASSSSPPAGYVFHWLCGLLMCRDAKLLLSPWIWGCPEVSFGVVSTALKGGLSKSAAPNVRLEDSLRSLVISAAGGRRLDVLFRQLGEETLALLLDMNPDMPMLLDFLIDRCYTSTLNIVEAIFIVICRKFISNPNFACNKTEMLVLAMVFSESSVSSIREQATYLLQTLYHLFFLNPSRLVHNRLHQDIVTGNNPAEAFKPSVSVNNCCLPSPSDSESQCCLLEPCLSALADELLWRAIGHWKPSDVIRQFCAQHPTSTLPFLSEICKRLATATADMRCCLLRFLHYWTINVELVDLFARISEPSLAAYPTRYRTASSHFSARQSLFAPDLLSPESGPAIKAPRGARSSAGHPQHQGTADLAGGATVVSTGTGGGAADGTSSSGSSDSSVDGDGGDSEDSSNCDYDVDLAGGQPTVARRTRPTSLRSDLPYARRRVQLLSNNEAWASVPLTLRSSGWGSQQATEMILNNFFYLTIRFGNQASEGAALKELWMLLIRYRPENLRYILHYLIVVVSLAPATLSSHVNRIISYLAEEDVKGVINILMVELQTIDGMGLVIEPVQSPPYFCLSTSLPAASPGSLSAGTMGVAGDRETSPGSELGSRLAANDSAPPDVQPRTTVADEAPIQQVLAGQRRSLYVEARSPSTSRQRPHSVCSLQVADQSPAQPNTDANPAAAGPGMMDTTCNNASTVSSGNAISRFATRASAVGRRAIRSALNRQDEKESHTSPNRSKQTKYTAAPDTMELEIDVDNSGLGVVESSVMVVDGSGIAPSQAAVAARCNTLPNTETARERYNKQAAGLGDKSRPSRIKKILSKRARRAAKEYDRTNPSASQRNSRLRAIFKGSGGSGGGGSGGIEGQTGGNAGTDCAGGVVVAAAAARGVSSTLDAPLSVRPLDEALLARLQTASLPPNLASLQPLLLPLHSNSRAGFVDFRQRTARFCISSSGGGVGGGGDGGSSSLEGRSRDQPLPMPENGVYYAPIQEWFIEPFVTNGATVLTGMWSPTGARSPLILLLVGEIAKSPHRHRIAWRQHLPILLLCVFLGLDHCRPLIQETSKKLLINLLRVTCPRIEALRLLSLQLEVERQSCSKAIATFASRLPAFCLTVDGGPCRDIFSTLSPVDEAFSNVSSCPAWKAYTTSTVVACKPTPVDAPMLFSHSSSGSPPGLSPSDPHLPKLPTTEMLPYAASSGSGAAGVGNPRAVAPSARYPLGLFGSTYSLMSTATLIPGSSPADAELKRRSIVAMVDQQHVPPPLLLHQPLDVEISAPPHAIPTVLEGAETGVEGEQTSLSPLVNASRGLDGLDEVGGGIRFTGTGSNADRTPIPLSNDCESQHMHAAAEEIRKLMDEIQDRSIWTWEDVTPARFQQVTLLSLTHASDLLSLISRPPGESAAAAPSAPLGNQNGCSKRESLILLRSAGFLQRLVCCVVAVVAEAEAGCQEAPICLQCHHGARHTHSTPTAGTAAAAADAPTTAAITTTTTTGTTKTAVEDEGHEDAFTNAGLSSSSTSCTVTRFAQAAFDMGLTCPNKHYASRSLQIYRSLEAQLDEVRLSKVLALLTESIAENSDDIQGYVVELFLTLEGALDHLQRRGTVPFLSPFPVSLATRSPLESPHAMASVHSGPLPTGSNNIDIADDGVISRKPPAPQPTGVNTSTAAAATAAPVVHERRHSRRGSSSSLCSLLNTAAAPISAGGQTAPRCHGSNASLGSMCGATESATMPQEQATGGYVAPATPGRRVLTPHEEVAEVEAAAAVKVSSFGGGEPTSTAAATAAKRSPRKSLSGPGSNNQKSNSEAGTCRLSQDEQAELVSRIFWIGVCLLDSDYEYEYLAGLRLLNRLLPAVCMSPAAYFANGGTGRRWNNPSFVLHPSLHERVQKTLLRFKWEPEFPGLLSLLIKGCSSQQLIDPTYRLLIRTIPALKSPVVDPFSAAAAASGGDGSRHYRRLHHHNHHQISAASRPTPAISQTYPGSLPTLVLTLLPLLLTAWDEDPENPANAQDFGVCHTAAAAAGSGSLQAAGAGTIKNSLHALTELTDIAATYGLEGAGSNGSSCPPGSNMGPPLGSWAYRCNANAAAAAVDVGAACGAYPPSSGYLSLVTATVAGGSAAKKAPAIRPRNPICILAAEQLADLAIQTDAVRFNNLAIVLRLYATGTFSKDVNQWAKCVTRYLIDGCPALGPKLLSYLTALLTLAPACVHLPLLHFAYWFLQSVELNQGEMNTRIRTFITSTSEKFVNTPLWPEVTLVLQAIVARSATLTSAPAPTSMYTLPGLDPSGSGRVLDLAAAAAAVAVPLPESEPQRIALAGRVLDFDVSVLQNTAIVGAQFIGQAGGADGNSAQSAAAASSRPSGSSLRPTTANAAAEDTGTTTIEALVGKSFFRVGCWKTPWTCQSRIRSRLCCLLSCYGTELDHLTSQRSPSVIFSQSTETLDHQLSMPSSSETASINDASNIDDGRLDDTSSVERAAVFHDLDTYLDAQLMNINFLDLPDGTWEDETRRPWGVRGHSITSHTDFHEDGNETAGVPALNETTVCADSQSRKNLTLELPSKGGLDPHPLGSWSSPLDSPSTQPNPISANGAAGDGIVDEDLSATTNSADLAPARRDSISAHSNSSSVSVSRPRGISLLAPVLNRQFSSELMVAWVSQDSSPTDWLELSTSLSRKPAKSRGLKKASAAGAASQSSSRSHSTSHQRPLSAQPTPTAVSSTSLAQRAHFPNTLAGADYQPADDLNYYEPVFKRVSAVSAACQRDNRCSRPVLSKVFQRANRRSSLDQALELSRTSSVESLEEQQQPGLSIGRQGGGGSGGGSSIIINQSGGGGGASDQSSVQSFLSSGGSSLASFSDTGAPIHIEPVVAATAHLAVTTATVPATVMDQLTHSDRTIAASTPGAPVVARPSRLLSGPSSSEKYGTSTWRPAKPPRRHRQASNLNVNTPDGGGGGEEDGLYNSRLRQGKSETSSSRKKASGTSKSSECLCYAHGHQHIARGDRAEDSAHSLLLASSSIEQKWASELQAAMSERTPLSGMTLPQRQRLALLLTDFRVVFAGAKRRSTVRAVRHATLAFQNTIPSSDLDPEIRLANLAKIADAMNVFLPVPFFAIHPNSVPLLDPSLNVFLMNLGEGYHCWLSQMTKLSSICAQSKEASFDKLDSICQDLGEVLRCLLRTFELAVHLLHSARDILLATNTTTTKVRDLSCLAEDLFERLRPHIGSVFPESAGWGGQGETALPENWRLRIYEALQENTDASIRRALTIFCKATAPCNSISGDHVAAIVEIYFGQLWMEPSMSSGVALRFLPAVNSRAASTNAALPSSFFSFDTFLNAKGEPLPPAKLVTRFRRLLFEASSGN